MAGTRLNDAEEPFCWSMELTAFIAQLYTADQLVNSTDDVGGTDSVRLQYNIQFTYSNVTIIVNHLETER